MSLRAFEVSGQQELKTFRVETVTMPQLLSLLHWKHAET